MIQEGIRGTGQESVGKGSLSLPGMVPMAMKTNPLNLSRVYQGEGGRNEKAWIVAHAFIFLPDVW